MRVQRWEQTVDFGMFSSAMASFSRNELEPDQLELTIFSDSENLEIVMSPDDVDSMIELLTEARRKMGRLVQPGARLSGRRTEGIDIERNRRNGDESIHHSLQPDY